MHPQDSADQAAAAEAIEHHWQTGTYSHAEAIVANPQPKLVFSRLPNGDYEYLRPEGDLWPKQQPPGSA